MFRTWGTMFSVVAAAVCVAFGAASPAPLVYPATGIVVDETASLTVGGVAVPLAFEAGSPRGAWARRRCRRRARWASDAALPCELRGSRGWGLHFRRCAAVRVFRAKIFSGADGVDPDASRDVALDGVFIHAWDDAVAVKTTVAGSPATNVAVANSIVSTRKSAFKLGTESLSNFTRVSFATSDVFDSGRGLVIYAKDGGAFDDAAFEDLRLLDFTTTPASLRAPFAGNATFLFDCKNDDIAAGGVEVAGLDVDWARTAAPGSGSLGDAVRAAEPVVAVPPGPADAARVASWKLMLADGAAVELTFASPGDLEASRLALLVGGFTLGAAAGRCGRREALDAENASRRRPAPAAGDADGAAYYAENDYGSPSVGFFSFRVALPTSLGVVRRVYEAVEREFPEVEKATHAEFWAHRRRHGHGHELHYDSVPGLRAGDAPRHPLVSTVLCVDGAAGGPTLVTDQTFGSEASRCWAAAPRANRLLAFDGRALHGVLPGAGSAPGRRVTRPDVRRRAGPGGDARRLRRVPPPGCAWPADLAAARRGRGAAPRAPRRPRLYYVVFRAPGAAPGP
ncbi:metallo-sulfur cluster assembly [Aureococcus anophagefferens]|nr:metallo-sulfur cluster assembly [Aureococcus anophagefferens]